MPADVAWIFVYIVFSKYMIICRDIYFNYHFHTEGITVGIKCIIVDNIAYEIIYLIYFKVLLCRTYLLYLYPPLQKYKYINTVTLEIIVTLNNNKVNIFIIGAFGDYRVIGHVCWSVCLFVCLFVHRFSMKLLEIGRQNFVFRLEFISKEAY